MHAQLISRAFEDRIRDKFKVNPQVVQFLLRHERRSLVEKNLAREVRIAELKFGTRFNLKMLRNLCFVGVDAFAHIALEHKHGQLMSEAERKAMERKSGREKDAAAWYEDEKKEALSTAVTVSMHRPESKAEGSAND